MAIYITCDFETATAIDEFRTREQAMMAVAGYYAADKADNAFEDGFYAIREGEDGELTRICEFSIAASLLGRKGGHAGKGIPKPASRENIRKALASLTPEERKERAKKAAAARWAKNEDK